MSWHKMNHYELQAMRKLLMLDVKEAADYIGQCSARAWQHWESGRNAVPDDIEMEIYGLIGNRNLVVEEAYVGSGEMGALKYYKTLDAFLVDYPESNAVSWRLHQSITAYLFGEGGEVELSEEIETDKESYIYKFFSKTREEDIEHARQEEIFNRR